MYSIKASSFSCTENGKNVLHVQSIGRFQAPTTKKIQFSNPKILSTNLFREKRRNTLSTHKRVQYIFWKLFVCFVFDFLSRMISTFSQKQIAYEIFAWKLLSLSFFYYRNGERPSVCFTAQEFNAFCFFFKSLKGINLGLCLLSVSLRSH